MRVFTLRALSVPLVALLFPGSAQSQSLPPALLMNLSIPNGAAKGLMTPTAQGAAYKAVFLGAGYTNDVPYNEGAPDGTLSGGIGLFDPVGAVGVQLGATMADVSGVGNFSFSIKVHRYLGHGTTLAVGGESLFSDTHVSDFDSESYFAVVSHAFGFAKNRRGLSRIHASAGFGSGRFLNKTPADVAAGKGERGTGVFGNLALEILPDVNVVGEWTGTNLSAGLGLVVPVPGMPLGVVVGMTDLTDQSGDGNARFIFSGGFGYSLF